MDEFNTGYDRCSIQGQEMNGDEETDRSRDRRVGCDGRRVPTGSPALEVKPGSTVTLQKKDGVTVVGPPCRGQAGTPRRRNPTGRTEVRRAEVTTLKTDSTSALNDATAPAVQPVGSTGRESGPAVVPAANAAEAPKAGSDDPAAGPRALPEYREVTLPAGTVLPVELTTRVGSEIEQRRGRGSRHAAPCGRASAACRPSLRGRPSSAT